jgi:transcriptional regulator with XRE-family HTH domain
MEPLATFLVQRREAMGFGVRELCRKTESRDCVAETISPTYYSRLERGGVGHCEMDKVSFDKLWALGVVLLVSPLVLFAMSRGIDPELFERLWAVCDSSSGIEFGMFVRRRRQDLELSLRQACALSEQTPFHISMGFWSQFETNFREQSGKLSGEKLVGIGMVLDVDPLLLYVLSREMPDRYLSKKNRDLLFS